MKSGGCERWTTAVRFNTSLEPASISLWNPLQIRYQSFGMIYLRSANRATRPPGGRTSEMKLNIKIVQVYNCHRRTWVISLPARTVHLHSGYNVVVQLAEQQSAEHFNSSFHISYFKFEQFPIFISYFSDSENAPKRAVQLFFDSFNIF